jgi:SAM-dependent methyltransferase
MKNNSSIDHYNQKYFDYQKEIGIFGGFANQIKFENLIKENKKVLDFGCGGGYLLSTFKNIERYGVEINPIAKDEAIKNNIIVFDSSQKLPSEYFDLIISNNSLEHTHNPLLELKELYRSLKKGGMICLVVPLDSINYKYKENDIDFHLYSWSPMNLGNLLITANFKVISSEPFIHKWIPFWRRFKKLLNGKTSWYIFHILCKIYGRIDRKWWQVKAIGVKK